jgi:hypothetical protein
MGIVQISIDLEEAGILASLDPDPSGAHVRAAKARGLSGVELDPLSEDRLSGGLRLTLTPERAEALRNELDKHLEG